MICVSHHLGWAYDLKTVSQDMIKKRVLRTGDGSHIYSLLEGNNNIQAKDNGKMLWGWEDPDVSDAEKTATKIR